ncbi:MAG: hypothetical protein ACHQAY_24910 [Hyphomicrobiales bacterium]
MHVAAIAALHKDQDISFRLGGPPMASFAVFSLYLQRRCIATWRCGKVRIAGIGRLNSLSQIKHCHFGANAERLVMPARPSLEFNRFHRYW